MRIVLFCHSLYSDWNHGNAHFLRGIVCEWQRRGHQVSVFEPKDNWSMQNLLSERGEPALDGFRACYPTLKSTRYEELDLPEALNGADLVVVHEWNEPDLVRAIGEHRKQSGKYRLLFHDTHHRSVTAPHEMERYDLSNYDGVLAFGETVRQVYCQRGWARMVWTWHEAADPHIFKPMDDVEKEGDLVWVGNWGDDERTAELREYLIEPVRRLGLKARVYGVRYPAEAQQELADAGIEYKGWLPNYEAPAVFAKHRVTVHVPRRPYATALPGIPTIRVFEALASGIPLVSAPWQDAEGLFTAGQDYLTARNGQEMEAMLKQVLTDSQLARGLAEQGRRTIMARHTCAHRVDELKEKNII